ncbi:hypothetical protein BCR35DRAFT_328886 [Leucosporidium creatinivorum]|uniref:Uncharacterized protein n=1 Tax=Leucosporidium creatinivorum TaxID=106004 RepID=A0A1Y2G0U9_9BASI|nr:hypothetical protein BCR35DRAFT_328886 [Leucosporidium creatinivorum]
MDSLVNRPNTIHAQQTKFQADPRAVYQKVPRARLYMGLFMGLFTVGTIGTLHGVTLMMRGKKSGL